MIFNLALKPVDINPFLRAMAIMLVVFNHATWFNLHGGMAFLLLLSGYNLANFSFVKSSNEIIVDITRLALKIVLPSMLIMSFYLTLNQHFEWSQVFMISNWFFVNRADVVTMPLWYPQMFWQLSLFIILAFYLFPLSNLIKKNKVKTTLSLLVFSLLIYVLATYFFDTTHLKNRLPHLMLWNFVLGWVFWAMLNEKNLLNKIAVTPVLFISVVITSYSDLVSKALFLLLALFLIWLNKIYLPVLLAKIVNLISRAILFIFLLHFSFYRLFDHLVEGALLDYKLLVVFKFTFAMVASVLCWLMVTAVYNTIVRFKEAYISEKLVLN